MKELEGNLTKLAKKYSTLEKRRLLENEGFRTDLRRFKNRLLEDQKIIERSEIEGTRNDYDEGEEEGEEEGEQHAHLLAAQEELKIIQVSIFVKFSENSLETSKCLFIYSPSLK